MLGARSVRSRFQGTGVSAARRRGPRPGRPGGAGQRRAPTPRTDLPGRLYPEHPIEVLTEDSGDCWARLQLRMREIDEPRCAGCGAC
jgi:Ni,Fe-hydrogenase III large subunit